MTNFGVYLAYTSAFFMLSMSNKSHAGPVEGIGVGLPNKCMSELGGRDETFCMGYMLGIADQLQIDRQVCPPKGIKNGEVFAVIRKFVTDHPEDWHFGAAMLTSAALQRSFPCSMSLGK